MLEKEEVSLGRTSSSKQGCCSSNGQKCIVNAEGGFFDEESNYLRMHSI